MSSEDAMEPAFKGKVAILILGVAVITLGLFSHFQSSWVQSIEYNFTTIKYYQMCDVDNKQDHKYPACPSIALEHYFIVMIVLCFVLSLVNLSAGLVATAPMNWIDFGFHLISAMVLAVAGTLYIRSAVQIRKYLYFWDGVESEDDLKWEKVVAGGLTIVEACLYCFVAFKSILKADRASRCGEDEEEARAPNL